MEKDDRKISIGQIFLLGIFFLVVGTFIFSPQESKGEFNCGDAICDDVSGETVDNCCTDCGCAPGSTCAANVCTVDPFCGDAVCNGGEDCVSCAGDCGACPSCGDLVCNGAETTADCPGDCGTSCGDTVCNGGETTASCAPDCGTSCGDTVCNGAEVCDACVADCGACPVCGDMVCNGSETCETCAGDCGACTTCGDAVCNGAETTATCPGDCGSSCGDAVCNGAENCTTCLGDCGCAGGYTCNGSGTCVADPVCGDAVCNGSEDCTSCLGDCGCAANEYCSAGACLPYCGDASCSSGETTATCPEDCGTSCGDAVCNGAEVCDACVADCGVCPFCGDGAIGGSEICDDGNTNNGDGCSSLCKVTGGYTCSGTPSVCTNSCTVNADCNSTNGFVCNSGACTLPVSDTCVTNIRYHNDAPNVVFDGEIGSYPAGDLPPKGGIYFGRNDADVVSREALLASMTGGTVKIFSTVGDPVFSYTVSSVISENIPAYLMVLPSSSYVFGSPEPNLTDNTDYLVSLCPVNSTCGDGTVEGIETCDDGDTDSSDGCSSSCSIESGWDCSGAPSSCSSTCGDGVVVGAETCDDSNTNNGDGCSNSCVWEAPGAPTGFSGTTLSTTSVEWQWTDNSSYETSFKIYDGSDNLIHSSVSGSVSWTENSLSEGTSYTRYVVAENNGVASTSSSTVSATTLPSAPSTFGVLSKTENSITWQWTDNSGGEEGFKVRNGSGGLIDSVGANVLTYEETGLTEGTSYTRSVVAYNASGSQESASSGNVSATTVPTAPSVFSGTADSTTAITWQWIDNSTHEDGYKIYDGSNQLKGTVGADVTSWQETGLSAGQSYTRHVVAYKGSSVSSDSNSDSVSTISATPTAPSNLAGLADSTTAITWSWTDNSSNETGFKIYDGSSQLKGTVGAGVTSWQETSLTEGSSYTRYVVAINGAQESASSGNVSVATAPTAPSVFYGTADSSTAITWRWTDNSSNETGFKIYDGSSQLKGTVGAGVTSWQETGLSAGQSYTRHVVAYKDSSESSDSNSDSITTTTTPTAASNLTGSAASASSITWIWTDNASNETGFKLYNSSGTLIATISADTTTYSETGLNKNTAYSRYLKAYNSYGESSATDTASASTNDSAPTAPTLFIGSAVSSTKIDWSWADNSNDETGFRIYDGSGNLITTVGTNISSYAETGLTKNTSYTRYVTAYNGIGASSASSSYAVTTKADAPTSPDLSSPATSSLINTLTPTLVFKRSSDTDDGIDNYILVLNPGESDEKSITIANISDGGSQKNSFGVVMGASSTISFTLTDSTLLKDGANTWKVRAVDLGSNSAESDIYTFIINQKLPVVEKVTFSSALSSDNNEIITTASSGDLVIFLSSSSGLEELKVSLRKQIFIFGTSIGTQSVLEKTFVISGKNSVVTLPLSDLRTGKYQLLLNLKDTSGNITDWSRSIRVVTQEEAQGLSGALALSPADAKRLADEGKTVSRTPLNMRLDELANYGADLRSKQADSADQFLERYLTFEQVSNLNTKIAIFSRRLKDSIFNVLGKSGRTLSHIISQPIRHRFSMMSLAASEASKSGKTNRMELALQTQKYFEIISTPVRVVFQRVGTSVRVAWDVMSGNHEGALKIAEVKIESVGKTQASISWKTNRVARGKVNYGNSPAYGMELFIDDYTTNHHAVLTGLSAGHKYFFEVLATDLKSQNAFDAFYSFDTPE